METRQFRPFFRCESLTASGYCGDGRFYIDLIFHLPDDLSGVPDRALMLIGFADGCSRRSDLAS